MIVPLIAVQYWWQMGESGGGILDWTVPDNAGAQCYRSR